jgi:hypothetical protein
MDATAAVDGCKLMVHECDRRSDIASYSFMET